MLDLAFNRRNFLRVGGIFGFTALTSGMTDTAFANSLPADKSVIWIWLGGGPSSQELFSPSKLADFSPLAHNGRKIHTNVTELGGVLENTSKIVDKLTIVNSFSHGNADHDKATHLVMTGYEQNQPTGQTSPAMGAIISKLKGGSKTGLPAYVCCNNVTYDDGAWLGGVYNPFDANSDAKKNFIPQTEIRRLQERLAFLGVVDKKFHPGHPNTKALEGLRKQAYDVVAGEARMAFEVQNEPLAVREAYGKGFGERLLLARRLTQYGAKFVTVSIGGWDMHENLAPSMEKTGGEFDVGFAALINDLHRLSLDKNTLVVVTGEFSRTKVNNNAKPGRDHNPRAGTLVFAGGNFEHGKTYGEQDSKGLEVKDKPVKPVDVIGTVFDHFGLSHNLQETDMQGRPRYFIEGGKCNKIL